MKISPKIQIGLGAIIILIMAVLELLMDRSPWCTCGQIRFWHSLAISSEDSQQLFDWYAFTHIIHGLGFYLLLWLVDRKKRLSLGAKFLIALGMECAWELIENSNIIIDRYRAATISLYYYGDSVLNSLGDIVSMALGFWLAARQKVWVSVSLFIAIEIILAMTLRDNLTLNIIMLIHPIQAIKTWQSGG